MIAWLRRTKSDRFRTLTCAHTCISNIVRGGLCRTLKENGTLKEKGLKTPDGRARSAGVSRNWSVLYVSYLEVTFAEGVYKLYVVYRRQRSEILGTWGGNGEGEGRRLQLEGNCCCYRRFIRTIARPINESAPQALDGCPLVRPKRKPSVSVGFTTEEREESASGSAWRIVGVYPRRARNSERSSLLCISLSISLSFSVVVL